MVCKNGFLVVKLGKMCRMLKIYMSIDLLCSIFEFGCV